MELVTEAQTVRISGAEYWDLFLADVTPTRMNAGLLLARWHELTQLLQRLAVEKEERDK